MLSTMARDSSSGWQLGTKRDGKCNWWLHLSIIFTISLSHGYDWVTKGLTEIVGANNYCWGKCSLIFPNQVVEGGCIEWS